MKLILGALIVAIAFSSCQKDIKDPLTPPTISVTDTSIIFTKKEISLYSQAADTFVSVYRKNMINGVKGYVVTTTETANPNTSTLSYFRYNNSGQLTELEHKQPAYPQRYSKVTLTWDQNRISRIKWDDNSSFGMDRRYHYEILNDTLLISYAYNVGRDQYLDSFTINIFAEKNFNKIYRIFKSCNFDYTTVFGESGVFYNERVFNYSGNDIASVSFTGETFFTSPTAPHDYESFDAVSHFTREQQVNPVLSDLETDMFGKEFKMLCYDDGQDTVAYFASDYFDYIVSGNTVQNYGNFSQVFVQSESALGASLAPLLTGIADFTLKTEVGVAGQQNGFVFSNVAYTFDSAKRIKSIRGYEPGTNNLIGEYLFIYP